MIPRYSNEAITKVWTDEAKLAGWDVVELSVIEARVTLRLVPDTDFASIKESLLDHPADISWWLAEDKRVSHDLNAYINERRRYIVPHLQHLFHEGMTSYDTEEAALALKLIKCCGIVEGAYRALRKTLIAQAKRYQFLAFWEKTHGQGAKLRSLGGRFLAWISELDEAYDAFEAAVRRCRRTRISGAIGNYGGNLTPEIESAALALLGLKATLGTQITTRVIQARLAQSLQLFAGVLCKIGIDFRLGARSGRPLFHEPFDPEQMGSSAMPHKKNTILTEQIEGLARMVDGYVAALVHSIKTWEARSIEQSCVERVCWPDLFHVMVRMFTVLDRVLTGLVVYPDNMILEIRESCGAYASDEAKTFLAAEFGKRSIEPETAYRIMQLASFCALNPRGVWQEIRRIIPQDLDAADRVLELAVTSEPVRPQSIRNLVLEAGLFTVPGLKAQTQDVTAWNAMLKDVFKDPEVVAEWNKTFTISHLLGPERAIFERYDIAT